MQYCPHQDLGGKANIIVAGSAVVGTIHVLSPFGNDSNTWLNHRALARANSVADTSAGIAAHLIEQGLPESCQLASSDKFSVDALAGLFSIVDCGKSVSPDILTSMARMALYEHGDDRDLAHIIFILNSWMHPQDSPLNAQMFQLSEAELSNVLFEELLSRLPKIVAKVDYLERYWIKEELKLELTENLISEGTILLETDDDLDLAVFTVPARELEEGGRLHDPGKGAAKSQWIDRLHPIGLHNRTSCSRILVQSGSQRYFYYRADSLCLAKRALIAARKDLHSLTLALNQLEGADDAWINDSIDQLKPSLRLAGSGESKISQQTFLDTLSAFLAELI